MRVFNKLRGRWRTQMGGQAPTGGGMLPMAVIGCAASVGGTPRDRSAALDSRGAIALHFRDGIIPKSVPAAVGCLAVRLTHWLEKRIA